MQNYKSVIFILNKFGWCTYWSQGEGDASIIKEEIIEGKKAFIISLSPRMASIPNFRFGKNRTACIWADQIRHLRTS